MGNVKRVSKSEELTKAKQRLDKAKKELVSSGASAILAEINKDPVKKQNFDQMNTSQQAQYISKQFTLGNASAGQAWLSYRSALNRFDRLEKEIQQDKAKAIKDKWENASYNQQKDRKRWNENKAKEAKRNIQYFRNRIASINQNKDPKAVFQARKYMGKGQYASNITSMNKKDYLEHCKRELQRWTKAAHDYNWGAKDAEAKMKAMGTKPKVKGDSEKANKVKRTMKRTKELPEALKMPQVVQDKLKELGNGYTLFTLSDSKGNRIYCFEKDGKHAAVMTHIKGQEPSKYMEVKSNAMYALVSEAGKQYGKGDFTNIIGKMKELDAINAINEAKSIGLSDLNKQLNQEKSVPKDKIIPTVTVVPKIKKNGKPSKKNFNIQLMDADGKVFILDKKMVEKAVKQQGNAAATRGEMVDFSWKNYLEAAKEGKLSPETVASCFNGQANLGETNTKADGSTITLNNAEKPIETGSVPPADVDETTKNKKLIYIYQSKGQNS